LWDGVWLGGVDIVGVVGLVLVVIDEDCVVGD